MRLLLDTHALLWFQAGDRRLSQTARRAIEADDAELLVSAASVWEMAIKASLGRLRLSDPVEAYMTKKIAQGYRMLPVSWAHAAKVEALPWHHRDPFDRLLVAQAAEDGYTVVTRDSALDAYGIAILKA